MGDIGIANKQLHRIIQFFFMLKPFLFFFRLKQFRPVLVCYTVIFHIISTVRGTIPRKAEGTEVWIVARDGRRNRVQRTGSTCPCTGRTAPAFTIARRTVRKSHAVHTAPKLLRHEFGAPRFMGEALEKKKSAVPTTRTAEQGTVRDFSSMYPRACFYWSSRVHAKSRFHLYTDRC